MEKTHEQIISEYMSEKGKKGGATTKKRYGREHFRELAKSKRGMHWSWAPDKKGPRAKKDGLQSKTKGAKIQP